MHTTHAALPGATATEARADADPRWTWWRLLPLAAWALASAAPLRWMFVALSQPVHVVQRVIVLCLAIAGAWSIASRFDPTHPHPHALPIALAGVAVAAAARMATDVQAIHAATSLLLLHALTATFLDARTWRECRTPLLVLLLCLPVQPHVDALLGLPLRLWTAQVVAPLLEVAGVVNVTVESIIVTENGVADVANACSGVRTLWYAMGLWLCARVAWPQAPRLRWWLAGLACAAVAVGFNALRVALLVFALHHRAPPLLAEMAHSAMGLLALAAVGAITALLCSSRQQATTSGAAVESHVLPWHSLAALACLVATVGFLPSPTRSSADPARLVALTWPAELHTQALPFSREERNLVLGHHATVAEKHGFRSQGVQGSLLVVDSPSWRAQHAPELCLLAQGAQVERIETVATAQGAFRVVTMRAGTQAAITWFQSNTRVVPDLGARLWSQLLRPQERWSLVTVVVDGPLPAAAALNLHRAVHGVVASSHQDSR